MNRALVISRNLRVVVLSSVLLALSPWAVAQGCEECGRVTSVKTVKTEGEASGGGAIVGGLVGGLIGNEIGAGKGRTVATVAGVAGGAYAGHQIEKNAKGKTVYRVTVAMDDGDTRTFTYKKAPGFAKGDRVQVRDGKLRRLP